MTGAWIVVLGLAWGNPDSRITGIGEVLKIERIEVATEAQCLRAATDWIRVNRSWGNSNKDSGSYVFATCAGQVP